MKHLFSLPLVAALAVAPAAHAGTDRWTPFGPGDGEVRSLAASSRGDLYVATSFTAGEIWQRPGGATRWRWRGQGLGRPGASSAIALAVHPKNPNALWAVVPEPGGSNLESVFRSTDGGATWRKRFTGDAAFRVARLTVAPTRTSPVLLAEVGDQPPRRLWRSADLGATWSEIPDARGPVAAPPDLPETVYAASASGGGLLKSTDGGRTFRSAGALPIGADDRILVLHATSGRPATLFVSLQRAGLFRSIDGGVSWRRVGFSEQGGPSALASEPSAPKKVYAIDSAFLYASDRGGASGSFREIATFAPEGAFPPPTTLVAAPGGPYFLSRSDLFRLSPPGRFVPVDKAGVEAFRARELRISPRDPDFVSLRRQTACRAGACDVRTLLSTDGGRSYTRLGAQTAAHRFSDVLDLAFDPADPRRRLAIGPVGIVLTDPATGDRTVRTGLEEVVEIAASGVLLAGGAGGIAISEDDGASWTTAIDGVVPPSPAHPAGGTRRFVDLATDPYDAERLIARALESTSGAPNDPGTIALYKSADAGRSWSKLRDGDADVEHIVGAPDGLYLLVQSAAGAEVLRSDDFGATTALVHRFAPTEGARDLATDPNAPGDLYAATRQGVRRSRDGGVTWEATAGGFAPYGGFRRSIDRVQVAPDRAGRLIASPHDGGLFENRLSD